MMAELFLAVAAFFVAMAFATTVALTTVAGAMTFAVTSAELAEDRTRVFPQLGFAAAAAKLNQTIGDNDLKGFAHCVERFAGNNAGCQRIAAYLLRDDRLV